MRQCIFLTLTDSQHGFNLAGFSQLIVDPSQLEATVLNNMENQAVGMIVIDERLLEGMEEDRLRAMEKRWNGIVVVLPRPARLTEDGEDFAMRLIRRAVGYQVRLQP